MAVLNFKSMAQAIAARFSAANVTPPAGESNVALSTEALPDAIMNEPTVLVFPPQVEFRYGSGSRLGTADFPVRFYIYKSADTPRRADLLLDWSSALYNQLEGQVHLGLSATGVNDSRITGFSTGEMTYNGTAYHGIEFNVHVVLGEGLSPTA